MSMLFCQWCARGGEFLYIELNVVVNRGQEIQEWGNWRSSRGYSRDGLGAKELGQIG